MRITLAGDEEFVEIEPLDVHCRCKHKWSGEEQCRNQADYYIGYHDTLEDHTVCSSCLFTILREAGLNAQ